jgi:hypothetical protein
MGVRFPLGLPQKKTVYESILFSFGNFLEESNRRSRIFSAEKIGEAVPRPNASDGEHSSRGAIPPGATNKDLSLAYP